MRIVHGGCSSGTTTRISASNFISASVGAGQYVYRTSRPVDILFMTTMLYAASGILVILWIAGLATSRELGGFLHLFLVFSILIVLAALVWGEKQS